MAQLEIRRYPDPVLREAAPPVEAVDGSVRRLVEDMRETMYAAPGVGLAAPQVGMQRRVLVYDIGEGFHALVNPRISRRQGEVTEDEGCLSIPGLTYPVVRARLVRVEGLDADGRDVAYEAEDMEARVIQHEVDHLDGILFLDRLDRETRKEALRAFREHSLGIGEPSSPPAAKL